MIVLDASALVNVIMNQPERDQILDHLDQPVIAPTHQLAEVLSVIARLLRAGDLQPDEATAALAEAVALEQRFIPPDRRHLARSLELSGRIRVPDGLYVALAESHDCALLTSDARLAAADPPCEVRLVRRSAA